MDGAAAGAGFAHPAGFDRSPQLSGTVAKGKESTLTFAYDGRLTGNEESPVYGIKFAAIQHDFALPDVSRRAGSRSTITPRTASRADLRITVPRVTGDRQRHRGTRSRRGDKITYSFKFNQPSFPGSIAVVQGEPARSPRGRHHHPLLPRPRSDMAQPYGEEIGKTCRTSPASTAAAARQPDGG